MDNNIINKVVLAGGDLSALTADEKLQFIKIMEKQSGLEDQVAPFKILKIEGREVLYADKGTAEALRRKHNLSFTEPRFEKEGNIYTCIIGIQNIVDAKHQNGVRTDYDCGVVSVEGLDALGTANAKMACMTKAKRRATLSFCGLGMIDESEFDTIQAKMTTAEISNTGLQIDEKKVEASKSMVKEAVELNADKQSEPTTEVTADPKYIIEGIDSAQPKDLLSRLEGWLKANTNANTETMFSDAHKRTPKTVKAMLIAISEGKIVDYFREKVSTELVIKGTKGIAAPKIRESFKHDLSIFTDPGSDGRSMMDRMKLAEMCASMEDKILEMYPDLFTDIEGFYKFATVSQIAIALGDE